MNTAGTKVATGKAVDNSGAGPAGGLAVTTEPAPMAAPDPEVVARPSRRRFAAEYKLRVLQETDRQTEPGAVGALLRREGLYSTHLSAWRRQRDQGALEALKSQRRGRKPEPSQGLRQRIAELESDKERLQERLRQAEAIISAQKKLSEILGLGMMATQREIA